LLDLIAWFDLKTSKPPKKSAQLGSSRRRTCPGLDPAPFQTQRLERCRVKPGTNRRNRRPRCPASEQNAQQAGQDKPAQQHGPIARIEAEKSTFGGESLHTFSRQSLHGEPHIDDLEGPKLMSL
jgi:hypothetical protein